MSVFVDTGPWFASVVPSDPRHSAVLAWHHTNSFAEFGTIELLP